MEISPRVSRRKDPNPAMFFYEPDKFNPAMKINCFFISLLFCVFAPFQSSSYAQFKCDLTTSAKPWTKTPQIESRNYRFAILADKTGGGETGAFEKAIAEINQLAPDFVITVGDLIDGYVSDISYSAPQWDRLLSMIGKLEAPFFFVGGNHDLSSQLMTDDWKKRFGATYYSFTVGEDLFIVLDTEEHQGRAISQQQVDYFTPILKNWNGRWIYVFMHDPLWYGANRQGFEAIDSLLQGHSYTVFSGHEHQYYMERQNGMEYYMLATTGGDSRLHGARVGEFDHYLFVTAHDPQPTIANLALGSVLPNDIVNPQTKPYVSTLLNAAYFTLPPVILPKADATAFDFEIDVRNPHPQPLFYKAVMPTETGGSFSPSIVDTIIGPKASMKIPVHVSMKTGNAATHSSEMVVKAWGGYLLAGERTDIATQKRLLLDWPHVITAGETTQITCTCPDDVSEDWDWHGAEDGSFDFSLSYKGKELILKIRTKDDKLITNDLRTAPQDKIEVWFSKDAQNDFRSFGQWELRSGQPIRSCGTDATRLRGKCWQEGNSLIGEIILPANLHAGERFRLNIAFTDCDDPRNTKPSVLWWKPRWGGARDFSNSGLFIIE